MALMVTHADAFHPDEMLAIALLLKAHHQEPSDLVFVPEEALDQALQNPTDLWRVARTRNVELLGKIKNNPNVYMIDVGADYDPQRLNFDHHHKAFQETWPNDCPMSSTGIVWKHLREQGKLQNWGSEALLDKIEEQLIQPVDAHDNGVHDFAFSEWVAGYNRPKNLFLDDSAHAHATFLKGVQACFDHVNNEIFSWTRRLEALPILEAAWQDAQARNSPIVILERSSPHHDSASMLLEMSGGQAELMITQRHTKPDQIPSWTILTLPQQPHEKFSMKCPMPLEWRGRSHFSVEEGQMVFAHKNGFMCVFEGSKEQALACAQRVLDFHGKSPFLSSTLPSARPHKP